MSKENYNLHKSFKCDRCGALCHYDKEYQYNLCYKCEHEFDMAIVAKLKEKNERLGVLVKSCSLCPVADSKDLLEQQLKEKDEEIEKLKKDKQWWKDHHKKANGENNRLCNEIIALQIQLKTITHQVCEKIREKYKSYICYTEWEFDCDGFEKLLDEIEKGDGNGI